MARRKVREYDAKRLITKHLGLQIKSAQATPETDMEKLEDENPWLKNERLVVKPDMLFGKRGKHKLVLLDSDFEGAKKFINENMNREIEISGVSGVLTHFLIEPFVPHKDEYYISITTTSEGEHIAFSDSGGMSVEENWDSMVHVDIPVDSTIEEMDLDNKLNGKLDEKRAANTIEFIHGAHKMFVDLDLTLLEMNPFTYDGSDHPFPLDIRMEIDDTAAFKNAAKWDGVKFPTPFGRKPFDEEQYIKDLDSKTGASLKLTILNPEGRIWTMVAGGGASVIYADTVVDLGYGEELANYGEYSGNPNEEETYLYAKTILDLATRPNPDTKLKTGNGKVLLIGGGIANFTDVANTFKGIIRAIREFKDKIIENKMDIYVRRGGPNYETGLKLMQELGKELGIHIEVYGPETSMTAIVPLAIKKLES
jgi:ATP citrate (pro-S)-lyase